MTALDDLPGSAGPTTKARGSVLVVDDDPGLIRAYRRVITRLGYQVAAAESAEAATTLVEGTTFDLIISDINLPGMDGLELLRHVRERDLDLPVIFVTGHPAVETAARAVEYGALRYMMKPLSSEQLSEVIEKAMRIRQMAAIRRQATAIHANDGRLLADRAGLEAGFRRAMERLWIAYQPIVRWSDRSTYAYEALVRSHEPMLPGPHALLDAAERLERVHELGRQVRTRVATALEGGLQGIAFVNLHAHDLLDDHLFDPRAPLSQNARRVVLEITERASLASVRDIAARAADLRKLGFRIAIDDMGAGYAGLTSFAQLEPEVVKLDMSLVRDVHREATKAKLIRSMTLLCRDMGLEVVAEGVERPEERDALIALGCDLLQGFLFARPHEIPPIAEW